MNIWILDSESGITLLYKPYMDLALDEDLTSGLLAALNQFTVFEFQQGIESIEMGGLRWAYLDEKDLNLLFVAAADKTTSSEMLRSRLYVIKQEFIDKYVQDQDEWNNLWKGNTELFNPFKDKIDEFYSQWLSAEKVTTLAEYYDILGVFQQLLNLLVNVIEGNIEDPAKENINNNIETMFTNYLSHEYVKNNPELSKFSFNQSTGINIISIDPSNCDMIVVEKQIINLMKRIITLIRNEIGFEQTSSLFMKENIYDYLVSNFTHLNELNLFKFLIKMFLLK